MLIEVFTDNKNIVGMFSNLQKNNSFIISIRDKATIGAALQKVPPLSVVYIDITSLDEGEVKTYMDPILKNQMHWCGLIDPKGEIANIGTLFHNGYADYISKKELKQPIEPERIHKLMEFKACNISDHLLKDNALSLNIINSPSNWEMIREGAEYTFVMLYLRLDHTSTLKMKYGYQFTDKLTNTFFDYFQKVIENINGKLWTKSINQGLFLIPYSPDEMNALLATYRLMLNKLIISGEILGAPELLDYTIILHLGNVDYLPQDLSGRAVSDSLNFLYHAANEKVAPGSLYVTDRLYEYIPKEIADLFEEIGNFEGHELKKLNNPGTPLHIQQ